MIRPPVIPFNSLTTLRPELIGLAAHLCVSHLGEYSREVALKHAAEFGNLDGLKGKFPFEDDVDHQLAAQALAEGKLLVAHIGMPPSAIRDEAPVRFHRNGNATLDEALAAQNFDPCGINGQSDPDDIEF